MDVNGVLLIDKPAGVTSFDVVRRVRRALRVKKAGHLGTLDPFATGLLPICVGEATKLTPYLLDADKTYWARLKLGEETDTLDATGRVVAQSEYLPGATAIYQAAACLTGEMEQTPPMYSAVHYQGERLYRLARQGKTVTVPPRRVVIHGVEVTEVALPFVGLKVTCSKGTYIRVLAADLGRSLGCGAHLVELRRLAVGDFRVEDALPLTMVEDSSSLLELQDRLIPLHRCLPGIKAIQLAAGDLARLQQGQAVPCPQPGLADGERIRVLGHNDLCALAVVRQQRQQKFLAPLRVFSQNRTPVQ